MKNDAEEFRKLVEEYKTKKIKFAKRKELILERIKSNETEVEEEIKSLENLEFVEKQDRGETRYALFFVYNKRKGELMFCLLKMK